MGWRVIETWRTEKEYRDLAENEKRKSMNLREKDTNVLFCFNWNRLLHPREKKPMEDKYTQKWWIIL